MKNQLDLVSWTRLANIGCLWSAAFFLTITDLPAASGEFRAGAAAIDITPRKLPVRTAGNLTETIVDKVTDALHVRCLVLEDGQTRLAITLVDSCILGQELVDEAKARASRQTGLPAGNILIAATHTHSAPAVIGVHGNDPELEYRAWLSGRIVEAIELAAKRVAPARIGWGKTQCPEYVNNRHWVMKPGKALTVKFSGRERDRAQMNPGHQHPDLLYQTGMTDPAVTVLAVQTKDGQPLALLGNYSTHYAGAPGVSADYFGEFCRIIGDQLGATNRQFVALMSNGTSGDANCIDFSKPARQFDRFDVAKAVASAALTAYARCEFVDWAPLAMATRELTLKVRLPSAREVAEAREFLDKNVGNRPIRNWEEDYARETVLMADWPATKTIPLQAIKIGAFGIGAIPCEVFGSTGLRIKQDSPMDLTMVIELANGYGGYIPPPKEFEFGGYTTWRARSSFLEIGAEPKIAQTVIQLLREVYGPMVAQKP